MEDQPQFTGIEGRKVEFSREMPVPFSPSVPEHGGPVHETLPTVQFIERPRRGVGTDTPPPFWPTLTGNTSDGFKLSMEDGYVFDRLSKTGDAVVPWLPTAIPDDTTVAIGDIVMVKVTESATGIVTAAAVEIATSVPASLAPVLPGGDNATGAAGYRYYKLCKVIADVSPLAKMEVYLTGNITHTSPALIDNTTGSAPTSGTGARLLKQFAAAAGGWLMRTLFRSDVSMIINEAGDNINLKAGGNNIKYEFKDGGSLVEEMWFRSGVYFTAEPSDWGDIDPVPDTIEVQVGDAKPWAVTDNGGGDVAIGGGIVLGYYMIYADANLGGFAASGDGDYQPESIVLGPGGSYAGGVLAIVGTKYIYAEIPRNGPTAEYTESQNSDTFINCVELSDDIEPAITDTATVLASSDPPNVYTATAGKAAVCIAKAVNDGAMDPVITVTPYVNHNPTVFIPVVKANWSI